MAVLVKNNQEMVSLDLGTIESSLKKVLEHLNCADKEVSVVFVDNAEITDINNRYLGRNYPTNVISFAMSDGEHGDINPYVLGDIVISVETALNDSRNEDIPLVHEIDFLMIHGLLHLLGYDHESPDSDSAAMKAKERELFLYLRGYVLDSEV